MLKYNLRKANLFYSLLTLIKIKTRTRKRKRKPDLTDSAFNIENLLSQYISR